MQLCAETIEWIYVMPGVLKFDGDCLIVLRRSLLANAPNEGCALLLGEEKKSDTFPGNGLWNVQFVWPCCNIWGLEILSSFQTETESSSTNPGQFSRQNRFAVDPREQIEAQKWGRKRNWKVLGIAHSHPEGDAFPSSKDLDWGIPGLMVIVASSGAIQGWWLTPERTLQTLKLDYLSDS